MANRQSFYNTVQDEMFSLTLEAERSHDLQLARCCSKEMRGGQSPRRSFTTCSWVIVVLLGALCYQEQHTHGFTQRYTFAARRSRTTRVQRLYNEWSEEYSAANGAASAPARSAEIGPEKSRKLGATSQYHQLLSSRYLSKSTIANSNGKKLGETSRYHKALSSDNGGSLGDIMSSYSSIASNTAVSSDNVSLETTDVVSSSPPKSGLVTNSGGTLERSFGHKMGGYLTPLERIALTANGNLQRIFSSYYDAPVNIFVEFCEKRAPNGMVDSSVNGYDIFSNADQGGFEVKSSTELDNEKVRCVWDRRVVLTVHSKIFCTASSVVTVRDENCIHLVESGEVGIGQLFRHLDKLPVFELQDASRTEEGGLWRQYELSCDELTCLITEVFEADAWNIMPNENHFEEHDFSF